MIAHIIWSLAFGIFISFAVGWVYTYIKKDESLTPYTITIVISTIVMIVTSKVL